MSRKNKKENAIEELVEALEGEQEKKQAVEAFVPSEDGGEPVLVGHVNSSDVLDEEDVAPEQAEVPSVGAAAFVKAARTPRPIEDLEPGEVGEFLHEGPYSDIEEQCRRRRVVLRRAKPFKGRENCWVVSARKR